MPEYESLRYDLEDGVATITLARPDKRNALNAAMFEELGSVAHEAAEDPSVRCVIVAAEGSSFCAGIDLLLLSELGAIQDSDSDLRRFVSGVQAPFRILATMPKATIAAVQGHAVGAGFQLALACDLRVAGHDVKLGMLEARFGLIPDLGGPHRLTRLVGPARAKELIWTTRLVEAEEALRLGLVQRVAPPGAILEEAHRWAQEILRHSPLAVRLAKELVESAVETPLDQHLAAAAEAQALCLRSDDHREAVSALMRGREAGHTGA